MRSICEGRQLSVICHVEAILEGVFTRPTVDSNTFFYNGRIIGYATERIHLGRSEMICGMEEPLHVPFYSCNMSRPSSKTDGRMVASGDNRVLHTVTHRRFCVRYSTYNDYGGVRYWGQYVRPIRDFPDQATFREKSVTTGLVGQA